MRIATYSLIIVAGFSVWEIKSNHSKLKQPVLAEINTPHGVDPAVIGKTIPVEHIARWESRNRIRKVCDGCNKYFQAFPGDVDEDISDSLSAKARLD